MLQLLSLMLMVSVLLLFIACEIRKLTAAVVAASHGSGSSYPSNQYCLTQISNNHALTDFLFVLFALFKTCLLLNSFSVSFGSCFEPLNEQ